MSRAKPDPATDLVRRSRRTAARERARLRFTLENFMEDQLDRIRQRLAEMDRRLHAAYLRSATDAIEATRPLGHTGPKLPSLDFYDGNQEGED